MPIIKLVKLTRFCAESGAPTQRCFFSNRLRVVGGACKQDNRGTTAASEEFFFPRAEPKCRRGSWERTKASDVAAVECLPRAGPMGDIFSGVLIHYAEDLLPSAPTSSFLFVLADVRQALWPFLSVFFPFLFGVGVESFSPKHHVFLIPGPFAWKLFWVPRSAFTAG